MRSVGVFAALIAGAAWAESAPSFDCARAESGAEKLICADPELARLDRLVAQRYQAALAVARRLDAGAAEAEAELKAYQRGWLKGRDECWKAAEERACIEFQYQFRDAELVTTWMLETPESTGFWTCGGSPANEVVTMFFDTEVPSVRFERGDSIDTGLLTETASGARYEGTFGRSMWIKGAEARYREPDPDGTEYACVLRLSQ